MINERALGHIIDISEGGVATITATLPNLYHAIDRKYNEVEIILPDGRRISPEQRRHCYILISEIAEFIEGYRTAETIEDTKQMLKLEFMVRRMEDIERRMFSLSDTSMTVAREFITFLIDFIIRHDIPTKVSLLEHCEDVSRYVYSCLVNKKCCICGKLADLHHVQSVGSQGYRDKINHIGLEALPLCREHHTLLHSMGNKKFMETYHLQAVEIDKKIAKVYGLNTKEK
jgi:hypothetical protein